MNEVDVAIVGATGAVGEVMREILEERDFPVRNLHLLASERSAGTVLTFRGKSIRVENLATFDFSQAQIGLFSAGGGISAEFAPIAAAAGCVVIDNTSHFRRDPEIPLIVPEVNLHRLPDYARHNIIANPNCSTIQMLVALKPIQDAVGISRINVATYQAVSGAGKRGVEELAGQTARLLNAQPFEMEAFPRQIAFNALPQIGDFEENGYTLEEMKMVWETRKIFDTIADNAANAGIVLGSERHAPVAVDRVQEAAIDHFLSGGVIARVGDFRRGDLLGGNGGHLDRAERLGPQVARVAAQDRLADARGARLVAQSERTLRQAGQSVHLGQLRSGGLIEAGGADRGERASAIPLGGLHEPCEVRVRFI